MSEHLTMPCGCKHARKISDDLKWGKHLGGTHDDHVGVQRASIAHHARHNHERDMEIQNVHEGQKAAILKKH